MLRELAHTWTLCKAGSDSWAISYTRRTLVLRYRICACSKSTLSTMITSHRTFSPVIPCWPCSINYNIQFQKNGTFCFVASHSHHNQLEGEKFKQ